MLTFENSVVNFGSACTDIYVHFYQRGKPIKWRDLFILVYKEGLQKQVYRTESLQYVKVCNQYNTLCPHISFLSLVYTYFCTHPCISAYGSVLLSENVYSIWALLLGSKFCFPSLSTSDQCNICTLCKMGPHSHTHTHTLPL